MDGPLQRDLQCLWVRAISDDFVDDLLYREHKGWMVFLYLSTRYAVDSCSLSVLQGAQDLVEFVNIRSLETLKVERGPRGYASERVNLLYMTTYNAIVTKCSLTALVVIPI